MSLEQEIKKVNINIERLAIAIEKLSNTSNTSNTPNTPTQDKLVSVKKTADVVGETLRKEVEEESGAESVTAEKVEETSKLTADTVKELAKEKIRAGTDRKVIKQMTKDLGGDTISELDAEGLSKLVDKLNKL